MAFPTIRSSASGYMTADGSTVTLTLPTGAVSGDLLMLFLSLDGNPLISAMTVGDGTWTLLANPTDTTANRYFIWYKIHDGSESNPAISWTDGVEAGSWVTLAITNGTFQGTPQISAVAYASSTTPNPPSITASWGSDDNLFLGCMGHDYNRTISTNPSNATIVQSSRCTITAGTGCSVAYSNTAAATFDMSNWVISLADTQYAFAIVIRPVSTGGPSFTNIKPNIGGSYKVVTAMGVNIGGVWKVVVGMWENVGGVWKQSVS